VRLAAILLILVGAAYADETSRYSSRFEPVAGRNLVQNASFECGDYLWSSLGKGTGWGGDISGLHGTIEAGGAPDGRHCLRIDLGPGITPQSYFDVWPPAHVVQAAPLAANVGWMTVSKGQPLTLSAQLRASVPGTKVRILFRFASTAPGRIREAAFEVTVTEEWARYSVTQAALDEDVCIAIGPDLSATPDAAASLWVDAVQLEANGEASAFETREPVEVGFATGRYGNVYDAADPVVLTVLGCNRSGEEAVLTLRQEWEDYFGKALEPLALSVKIPAGGQVSVPWGLPVPGKGYYRGRVMWSANGNEHVRPIKWAVIEPYTQDDSPFGLNHPAPTARQMKQLSKAGVRWVRNWSVNWGWVEPKPGEVSWAGPDPQLDYVSSIPMHNLVVFPNPSTNWASTAPDMVDEVLWHSMAYAPKDPQLLFNFIGQATARYRDKCHYWEFLNEPLWVPDFCLPMSAGYTIKDYMALLAGASKAIREADPEGKVIGGIANEPDSTLADEFIAAGGLQYCDILNLHPYGRMLAPEDFIAPMERIQAAMDAYGERKPIWATETAYYGVDDKPWEPWTVPPDHFSAGLLHPSERVTSDFIVRHAVILLSHGVEKILYHEPIEGPVNNGTYDIENTFLAEEGVPKKSYAALSALANFLGPAPRYVCPVEFPAAMGERALGYVFENGATAMAVVWAPGQDLSFVPPAGVTAYDAVGNPVDPANLVLGESPHYLVSASRNGHEPAERWFQEEK
jgi:hypothetical protein